MPAPLLPPADRSYRDSVGIYHWGGVRARGVAAGLRAISEMNATIARISFSPRMGLDYNAGPACLPSFRLATALDDADLTLALADPKLKVIMITAYDGTSFQDCQMHSYLNPNFYSPSNTAAIIAEYREFTLRLFELFSGTGKTVVLSNWEGDNALYCGAAYHYTVSPEFRASCDAAYGSHYAGNPAVSHSVQGMRLWFRARYSGVALGREDALAKFPGALDVFVAPEISAINMLRASGLPSVLYDVLPYVPYDFISYSAYESLAKPEPIAALVADLAAIRLVSGASQVILGEIGCPRSRCPQGVIQFSSSVINAALASGVRYVIQWNLYDQSASDDFGLFDTRGDITPLGRYYRRQYYSAPRRRRPPAAHAAE